MAKVIVVVIAFYLCAGRFGRLEEYAYPQVHKGLGEVNDPLPGVVDGHGCDGQVGPPVHQLPDDAVPLPGLVVVEAVDVVGDRVELVLEPNNVGDGLGE